MSIRFEVRRAALPTWRLRVEDPEPLAPDSARIRVEHFALTANNVTYAVFGEAMHYWDFFPPPDPEWGCIPVWGFGTVVESTADACAAGERLYGYFPMGSELVIEPARADGRGVTDGAAHRAAMAGAYNSYTRVTERVSTPDRERSRMLLYPLFFTSFLIDDFLHDQADFGADQIVLSSASSKTAIGVAFLAHRRGQRVVGITSPRHHAFVDGLGVYDDVIDYDHVEGATRAPLVFVDIAGNRDVVHELHAGAGDRMRHSMIVGGTHWDHEPEHAAAPLPGPAPAFFFAPAQITQRTRDWGRAELDRRIADAFGAFATWAGGWIEFRTAAGAEAVGEVYTSLLAGSPDPRTGFICSLGTSP